MSTKLGFAVTLGFCVGLLLSVFSGRAQLSFVEGLLRMLGSFFSPPYCSLVFVPLHRISFFVVWLIFDRLGSFLKGSEYKSRALILFVKFHICYFFILEGSAVIVLCYLMGCV